MKNFTIFIHHIKSSEDIPIKGYVHYIQFLQDTCGVVVLFGSLKGKYFGLNLPFDH